MVEQEKRRIRGSREKERRIFYILTPKPFS